MKKFLELQKVKKRDCIFVFRTLYTKGTYVTAPKKLLAARKGLKKIRGVKKWKTVKNWTEDAGLWNCTRHGWEGTAVSRTGTVWLGLIKMQPSIDRSALIVLTTTGRRRRRQWQPHADYECHCCSETIWFGQIWSISSTTSRLTKTKTI